MAIFMMETLSAKKYFCILGLFWELKRMDSLGFFRIGF
jgi:hypothetical protein